MCVVIYCSFIFSVCIFIFYFSSEILAKFSYSVNPRLNKVYVCVCMYGYDSQFRLDSHIAIGLLLYNKRYKYP